MRHIFHVCLKNFEFFCSQYILSIFGIVTEFALLTRKYKMREGEPL